MQHFVIGTAGHIDHGKTSLVKALTSIDCDTHPEEKKRGITINLGFAYSQQDNDQYLAFIDVPGHHRFIRNMISGASGIDYVMMIVAADDGIMPQTKEHFKICKLLGINQGVIVINKKDLVDKEQLDLVEEDIRTLVKGSFLESAKFFHVSAIKGDGIDSLKAHLLAQKIDTNLKSSSGKFRMYIDRSFNVDGFGTIVTGTVTDGQVKNEDNIIHLPSEKKLRVRQIQRHEKNVDQAPKGTRAALNITGIKKADLKMGDILVKSELFKTQRIDAHITLLDNVKTISKKFDALLYTGTYKTSAKVRLLDKHQITSNESALVQIDFTLPWYYFIDENFILRNTSSDKTIGGGFVIDPTPLHHKKKPQKLIDKLNSIVKNKTGFIAYKIDNSDKLISVDYFEKAFHAQAAEIAQIIADNNIFEIISSDKSKKYIANKENFNALKKQLLDNLHKTQQSDASAKSGLSKDRIKSLIASSLPYSNETSKQNYFDILVSSLEVDKGLLRQNNLWSHADFMASNPIQEDPDITALEQAIINEGFNSVGEKRINELAESQKIPYKKIRSITNHLIKEKRLQRFEKHFVHQQYIEEGKQKMLAHFKQDDTGLTVAQFRDIIEGNRRITMYLFEAYEKEGLVYRDGDFRKLR